MGYTDENGWSWSERLDGSWDFGNGYVVATVWRDCAWRTWDPTLEKQPQFEVEKASNLVEARRAAATQARLLGYTEACARLERDAARRELERLQASAPVDPVHACESSKVRPQWSQAEHTAVGLYAVLAHDASDFIDMVNEESDRDVLQVLHTMLVTPNPKHDASTIELNGIGASIVARVMQRKGIV